MFTESETVENPSSGDPQTATNSQRLLNEVNLKVDNGCFAVPLVFLENVAGFRVDEFVSQRNFGVIVDESEQVFFHEVE
ncbi:Uncharacterised protein [uncultured archaeon]|nr:Uncharacterised protein [uncultured archaeon]